MEQTMSTAQFVVIHMLQYEVLIMFIIAAILLWQLGARIRPYSTKTKEAAMAKYAALACLGALVMIAAASRILR